MIDTVTEEKVKFIRILRGVHNTFITPDSKFVVAGSTGGNVATVIDTETELPAWSIHFEGGVRPICFEANPDGSTKRMFVQVTNLHGFAIVDWATRKEVGRIKLPDVPAAERNNEGIQGAPAHGILIAPDGKTLWSTSKFNSHVYVYSVPDLAYLGAGQRRQGAGLAHLHARQQEAVRGERARQLRLGDRRGGAEGAGEDQGGTGAEAQHHGDSARVAGHPIGDQEGEEIRRREIRRKEVFS